MIAPARPPLDQMVTFLYVADLALSADFYGRLLQLPLVLDQGSCHIYRVSQSGFVGLCQHPPDQPAPARHGVILTLVSQDVAGWHSWLLAQGVAVEKAPALNPRYHIFHFFLRDPDGWLIEIQQFLDPAWPQGQAIQ
jgi:catechol 2,3-dioxygenase-like lactoylglutathione lyase family enzyme